MNKRTLDNLDAVRQDVITGIKAAWMEMLAESILNKWSADEIIRLLQHHPEPRVRNWLIGEIRRALEVQDE